MYNNNEDATLAVAAAATATAASANAAEKAYKETVWRKK